MEQSPIPQNLAAVISNGTTAEDSSIVQPVSLRQGRGTRLSFLGGRKKEPQQTNGEPQPLNGDIETASTRSRSLSKDNLHRRSFFRSHSQDVVAQPPNGNDTSDWVTDSGGRESTETSIAEKLARNGEKMQQDQPGVVKMGSVRKRLSLLKLGKKNSKGGGVMNSVDEE
jgi:dedicator of cytokinesis protein 3